MTYCTTCGMYDTILQTSDNHCCGECGDTEGIVWEDENEFEQLTKTENYKNYEQTELT